jgi:hypothetical protein
MRVSHRFCRRIASLVGVYVSLFSLPLHAQNTCTDVAGQNAVYGNCNNHALATTSSSAFVDAGIFGSLNTNICAVLNGILKSQTYPFVAGSVIDARGLPATGTSMTCSITPWSGITSPPASTILLPAGTIVSPGIWILPPGTHIIGEGDSIGSGTTIQASSTFSATAGPIVQFCSSACNGDVSLERVNLDGIGGPITGIANSFAGEGSFVDHVSLYQIRGTGLTVSGSATNSGPYSNITFDTGNYGGATTTVCAQISGLTATRGIRRLRCTSESSDASVAVLLDSSNNIVQDVTISGFHDGVLVGSNGVAKTNVLRNIVGDTANPCYPTCPVPINTVHISNHMTSGSANVADLSIMGVSNDGNGTYTIADDLTTTVLSEPFTGLYALGEPVSGGYSRLTTSANAATWVNGTTSTLSTSTCPQGSIYSCISSSCSNTLWACTSGGWLVVKQVVPPLIRQRTANEWATRPTPARASQRALAHVERFEVSWLAIGPVAGPDRWPSRQ